jgi:hypothetical protein
MNARAQHALMQYDSVIGAYSVKLSPERAAKSSVYVSELVQGSLSSTFYDMAVPQKTLLSSASSSSSTAISAGTVDFSSSGDGRLSANTWPSLPSAETYSVVWGGFVRPAASGTYTFQTDVADTTDRVRLWVDNVLVIDQWASLGSVQPSGALPGLSTEEHYSVRIEYRERWGSQKAVFKWKEGANAMAVVPTTALYRAGM